MTTIWEKIETALGSSLPVVESDYLSATGVKLPDTFLTYFLVTSPPLQAADNAETMRYYHVQVTYYSRDGLATMPDIATSNDIRWVLPSADA